MTDYRPRLSSVATGLRCACPRCGQGRLYRGLLTVRDVCEECGLDLSKLNTDDGAALGDASTACVDAIGRRARVEVRLIEDVAADAR